MSNNASASLDIGDVLGENPTETPEETPSFSLPDEYKEKPWAQGIDSMESLLKQFDNAQSLIGRKTIGVPGEGASEDEWNEFYNRMGRPEAPEKYEFEPASVPEGLELPEEIKRTEDEEKAIREIFHQAGLTKEQAKAVLKKTDEAFYAKYKDSIEEMKAQREAHDKEFLSLAEKEFGAEKTQMIAVAETLLKKYVPDALADHVRGLDNQSMLALSGALYKMYKETKGEGSFNKDVDHIKPARSPQELRDEARKIMADPAYQDPFSKQREGMAQKVKELYSEAARLESQSR